MDDMLVGKMHVITVLTDDSLLQWVVGQTKPLKLMLALFSY